MAIEAEALQAILKQHIKVDATGLSPAVASAFVTGFNEAVEAIRSALAEDTARAAEIKPAILNILKALTLEADAVRDVDDLQFACLAAKFYAHEALSALPLDKEATDANR